jgi:hypothetical protein
MECQMDRLGLLRLTRGVGADTTYISSVEGVTSSEGRGPDLSKVPAACTSAVAPCREQDSLIAIPSGQGDAINKAGDKCVDCHGYGNRQALSASRTNLVSSK